MSHSVEPLEDSKEFERSKIGPPIQIRSKKTYGLCSRILCCKCFTCCQEDDQSLLTSKNRKNLSKRLISQFKSSKNDEIQDPLQILIRMYIDDGDSDLYAQLNNTRINPNLATEHIWRDDLEFYLPQICNFLVFHEEGNNNQLREFLRQAGQIEFYFAHLLWFYLTSVSWTVTHNNTQSLPQVFFMLDELSEIFTNYYNGKQLISSSLATYLVGHQYSSPEEEGESKYLPKSHGNGDLEKNEVITSYGTSSYEVSTGDQIKIQINPEDIILKNYFKYEDYLEGKLENNRFEGNKPVLEEQNSNGNTQQILPSDTHPKFLNQEGGQINRESGQPCFKDGFASTIDFLNDLMQISESLKFANPKIVSLRHELQKMNAQLPAAVYIPFFTDNIRNHVVLNIVTQECKVFSTKERSPFYICIELYRSEETISGDLSRSTPIIEEKDESQNNSNKWKWPNDKLLSKPLTLFNQLNRQDSQIHSTYEREKSHLHKRNQTDDSVGSKGLIFEENRDLYSDENNNQITQPIMTCQQHNQNSMKNQSSIQQPVDQLQKNKKNSSFDLNTSVQYQNTKNMTLPLEQTSGISCVYERVMRVPTEYNLKEHQFNDDLIDEEQFSKDHEIIINPQHYASSGKSVTIYEKQCEEDGEQQVSSQQSIINTKNQSQIRNEIISPQFFGEDTTDQEKRIRDHSPFGHFKSWKLVHLIVKTGDNIKQEQFAVQLIYQFDQIFKKEGLDLKLTPYEILSIGPQQGILEMIKNSITFDGLKKSLHENYKQIKDLHQFFQVFYRKEELKKAQTNFCSSLAAYSLVCYFLQIKDRHNGNILLHKSGAIVHIDFGFLLSNAPGKGLAFEQSVPFKLLGEYIQILGGVESELFSTFRRLFFKGFQAAVKHQDKILILVKMLYSGHGPTLPCFEKGEQCITDLETRFNPPNVSSDPEMSLHCNMLINQSLDNWRARWYDKWQYFCQGIFY